MFEKMKKSIKLWNIMKAEQNAAPKAAPKKEKYIKEQYIIHQELESNITNLKNVLGKSDDVIFRDFKFGDKKQVKALICFIDGLGDKKLINEYIVKPLTTNIHTIGNVEKLLSGNILANLKDYVLDAVELKETELFEDVLDTVLSGATVLLIDGYNKALLLSAKGGEKRSVTEPDTEVVVRGPREGFTETLRVNTSLIRRKIKNPKLTFETLRLGKQTHTEVSIGYIDGIANSKVVEEVRRRLNRIETDAILESGYIEQFIEDNPYSPFATIGNSEKPDKVAAKLLEGRVAIFCSGTPFVLTVPYLFVEAFQVSEDYYTRSFIASAIRILRCLAYIITLTFPAVYIALETFHQEMIPDVLLITMAASREGIPFPAFLETILMLMIFELIRESGVRLPKQVGQAVSIVGALVIGEAAVRAGILSNPAIIMGALTGITGFIVPSMIDSIILFRFFLIILSGTLGLFGIVAGIMMIVTHMCSLRSFGTPYLSPFAPISREGLKDSFIRVPLWLMKSRPKAITWKKSIRQSQSSMPKAPDKGSGGKEN